MDRLYEYILATGAFDGDPLTVLDIGARDPLVDHWPVLGEHLRYLGIEADADECQRLNEAAAAADRPWTEQYFPVALGGAKEQRTFYVTAQPECSSLLPPTADNLHGCRIAQHVAVKRTASLSTTTLADWSQANNIESIDFMNVDVQGAELEVLQGGASTVNAALGIEVETEFVPIYEGQPLFGEVDRWIRSRGYLLFDINKVFIVRDDPPMPVASRGQLAWGDALYLRDVRHLMSGSRDDDQRLRQVMTLAIIADIYGRTDYALYVLGQASAGFASPSAADRINAVQSDFITHLRNQKPRLRDRALRRLLRTGPGRWGAGRVLDMASAIGRHTS